MTSQMRTLEEKENSVLWSWLQKLCLLPFPSMEGTQSTLTPQFCTNVMMRPVSTRWGAVCPSAQGSEGITPLIACQKSDEAYLEIRFAFFVLYALHFGKFHFLSFSPLFLLIIQTPAITRLELVGSEPAHDPGPQLKGQVKRGPATPHRPP